MNADNDLSRYVIYRCVVGSRAFGLAQEGSDTDRRGIYLPPADLQWSLDGVPEQLENDATQEVYWELQKFLNLALKSNPNVLECLYTPLVEMANPIAEELLSIRASFLSKLAYQKYNSYVDSQFKKLARDIANTGAPRWKHAMHLIRMLIAGITLFKEGDMPIAMTEHREALLAIRNGQMPWREIDAWRLSLHRDLAAAFATTRLPDAPDYARANALLLKARRSML